MLSPEVTSLQDRNKNLIRTYIDEIFNKHNLSSIEKYFGGNSIEGSSQAGKGGVGSKQFINEFFRTYREDISKEIKDAKVDVLTMFGMSLSVYTCI